MTTKIDEDDTSGIYQQIKRYWEEEGRPGKFLYLNAWWMTITDNGKLFFIKMGEGAMSETLYKSSSTANLFK